MKKTLLFFAFICSIQFSFAAFPSAETTVKAPTISMKNLTHEQQRALMEQFTKMSVKDYETITGKKMDFFEKLSFKLTQQRMKHQLKRDGSGLFSDFNVGGFLLGFLLGLLGVLIGYIFSSDSDLHKWTWIGFGIWIVIVLVFIV